MTTFYAAFASEALVLCIVLIATGKLLMWRGNQTVAVNAANHFTIRICSGDTCYRILQIGHLYVQCVEKVTNTSMI